MPGAIIRHFDLERGLPGGVDAKGIASSKILFNLQIIIGEEKKLLFVPDDIVLNKALTSTIHYLYSFIQFDSGYLGAYSTLLQFSGHTAARARVRGADKFGNLSVTTRVIGPKPAGIQAPEGSW